MNTTPPDFESITEAPGQQATAQQLFRIGQRYHFAKERGTGERILEIACGTGIGLRYLTHELDAFIIGGEFDAANLRALRQGESAGPRLPLLRCDAQHLPFPDNSLDAVICFEALYYFPDLAHFLDDARRVLRAKGRLILGTVNSAWPDFHPSPYTHTYPNNVELFALLTPRFQNVELFGGFPVERGGLKSTLVSALKRFASHANLIPGNLKARATLKRIFLGPTQPLPAQLDAACIPDATPVPLDTTAVNTTYTILYAVATKGAA